MKGERRISFTDAFSVDCSIVHITCIINFLRNYLFKTIISYLLNNDAIKIVS